MESVQFGILENVETCEKSGRGRGKRGRRRGRGWEAKAAQCEQATIYDAYVNSWNSGDTACSCHGVAEEKERSREGRGDSPEASRSIVKNAIDTGYGMGYICSSTNLERRFGR